MKIPTIPFNARWLQFLYHNWNNCFSRMNLQERSLSTWRVLMWWWQASFSIMTGWKRRYVPFFCTRHDECNNSDFIPVIHDSQANRLAESRCCWLCFLVWKHGEGRPEGPCGLQEVPDRRAVSGFWGKCCLMRLSLGFALNITILKHSVCLAHVC